MKNNVLIGALIIGVGFLIVAFQVPAPWPVPAEYESMENPIPSDDESLEIGEDLWKQHCKSCHGKEGLGDGPKAEQLDTPSGDFSTDEVQEQSDGALFYKTKIGRDDMPTYEKKIPDDEDIWHLVNYMRELR